MSVCQPSGLDKIAVDAAIRRAERHLAGTDPIMKRHPRYVEEGGRFVVPLPELSVASSTGPRN